MGIVANEPRWASSSSSRVESSPSVTGTCCRAWIARRIFTHPAYGPWLHTEHSPAPPIQHASGSNPLVSDSYPLQPRVALFPPPHWKLRAAELSQSAGGAGRFFLRQPALVPESHLGPRALPAAARPHQSASGVRQSHHCSSRYAHEDLGAVTQVLC